MNSDLEVLSKWISDVRLRLQLRKTKSLLISRKKLPPPANVLIDGEEVEQVSSYKLLGVWISDDLSWSHHIGAVCMRTKHLLGCLYRSFRLASSDCLNTIYRAVIRPMLEYSASAWSPSHSVHRVRLERVQSFAAKIVSKSWRTSPSALKARLHWPPLHSTRLYQQLCVCNTIIKGNSLIPSSAFHPHPRPYTVHSNSMLLFQMRVRSHQHGSSFFHSMVRHWNSLPDNIVSWDRVRMEEEEKC